MNQVTVLFITLSGSLTQATSVVITVWLPIYREQESTKKIIIINEKSRRTSKIATSLDTWEYSSDCKISFPHRFYFEKWNGMEFVIQAMKGISVWGAITQEGKRGWEMTREVMRWAWQCEWGRWRGKKVCSPLPPPPAAQPECPVPGPVQQQTQQQQQWAPLPLAPWVEPAQIQPLII